MRSERVLIYLPHGLIRDYLVSYYVSATSKQLAINAFCTGESTGGPDVVGDLHT